MLAESGLPTASPVANLVHCCLAPVEELCRAVWQCPQIKEHAVLHHSAQSMQLASSPCDRPCDSPLMPTSYCTMQQSRDSRFWRLIICCGT